MDIVRFGDVKSHLTSCFDYESSNNGEKHQVKPIGNDGSGIAYSLTHSVSFEPFETTILDTSINVSVPACNMSLVNLLISKKSPHIAINLISPLFSSTQPIKLQMTNVTSLRRTIEKDTVLFALIG